MNKFIGTMILVFASGLTNARAAGDLWAQKAARDRAIATQERSTRLAREQQRLLSGLERLPSGLNFSTAKCSDGWNNGDFDNKVGDICNEKGCVGLYARDPQRFDGFIFTCNFYLNNGSECHAEAFSSPKSGFAVFCVTTDLKETPRKLIYTE